MKGAKKHPGAIAAVMRWIGSGWEEGSCGDYVRNLPAGEIGLEVCRRGLYGLGGDSLQVYLPQVQRDEG